MKPQTLTEAVNLGKVYGIDTSETILALAIAKALAERHTRTHYGLIKAIKNNFSEECAKYKSQIDKPVTEEEKRKLIERNPFDNTAFPLDLDNAGVIKFSEE